MAFILSACLWGKESYYPCFIPVELRHRLIYLIAPSQTRKLNLKKWTFNLHVLPWTGNLLKLLKLCNSYFHLKSNRRGLCTRTSWGRFGLESLVNSSRGAGQLLAAKYLPVSHSKLVQDHLSFCIFFLPILKYSLSEPTVRSTEKVLFRVVKRRPAARGPRGCLRNEQLGSEVEDEVWMNIRYCMGVGLGFKVNLDGLRATWEWNIRLIVNSSRKMSTQGSAVVVGNKINNQTKN